MKLADGTEANPFCMDEATIALMQVSISQLELLEQLAMKLQARTSYTSGASGGYGYRTQRAATQA